MKRAWQNTVLVLFGLLAAFLILEGGLRAAGFRPGNPFERLINHYDAYLGYRMIPGTREHIEGPNGLYEAEINSLDLPDGNGFRDDGVSRPVFGVFLGDSFVWGYGVNISDAVSEKFEQLTGQDSVNLGMTSFTGPTQYARALEKYGKVFKPRYAFVGFFVGNDFEDDVNFLEWEKSGVKLSYPEWVTNRIRGYAPERPMYKVRRSLYNHLALYRFLSDRINFSSLIDRTNFLEAAPEKEDANTVHVQSEALDLYLYVNQLPSHIPELPSRAESVRAAMSWIKEVSRRDGIIPVVFIIPTKEMVYQDFFPENKLKSVLDPRYSGLIEILNDLEMSYIDLLPVFKEKAASREQLYLKYDGHWNEAGHLLAATTIRNFLAARGGLQTRVADEKI